MNGAPTLNVVLLTVDCWRGDHLGANGTCPSPTPHLDRLAAQGTVFQQAITAGGWTRPAMMALFSSVYASRHRGGSLRHLAPDLPVLGELLQARGYRTAGFTANPVCGRAGGFDRGLATFAELQADDRQSQIWNRLRRIQGLGRIVSLLLGWPLAHRLLRLAGVRLHLPEVTAGAPQLTDAVLAWLARARGSATFVWAHYMDLHWPYRLSRRQHRPRELARAWRDRQLYRQVVRSRGRADLGSRVRARWQALYREELATVDEQIGRLLAALVAGGQWARTVVVVTGDHGEEFYEHGTWAHSWNQLFDEGVHVPLIVRAPGLGVGRTVRQQVSLLDVAPTVLDLAGVPPPDTMLGTSLLPLLAGRAAAGDGGGEALVEMLGHRNSSRYRLAIRTATHRYIHDLARPHHSQLYDRRADPREQHNAYARLDPTAHHFDERRFDHMAPLIPALLEPGEDDALQGVDPQVAGRLRALGYIS